MQKLKLLAGTLLTALFLFPAFSSAQTISIVSGNGQLVCPDCVGASASYAPLIVQVNDSTGKASVNTTVTWVATQYGFSPVTSTSLTNSIGQATLKFQGYGFFFGSSFLPATIVASALNASVSFVETTTEPTLTGPGAGVPPVTINLVPASSAPPLKGLSGQTSTTSIVVSVSGSFAPLPGVQVRLQSSVPIPSVSCATQVGQQPGTVLTDSTGTAICKPVFGAGVGSDNYTIWVGDNYAFFGPAALTVSVGPPAIFKVISGNNQSVNAGVKAPIALTAQITDLGGDALGNVAVKWAVTAGSATLSNVVNTTIPSGSALGEVSAVVTPTAGPVTVTVSVANSPSISASFTINVNQVVTGLSVVSGNPQTAAEAAPFSAPLIVQVNDNSTPLSGITVNFAVTSGPLELSANSAVTNSSGQAQVTATAGSFSGAGIVTASIAGSTGIAPVVFTLTVIPPGPQITSVVNSAGFQNQFVSPCGLATIYGSGLTPGITGVVSSFVEPTNLVAGVSVQFGGSFAPILDVANVGGVESVSVQVPCEAPSSSATPPATVPMVVTVDGAASAAFPVTILPISPGIFQFVDSDGATRAVLVSQDGSYISVTNPARPGDIVRMFVTGLGQTAPALNTNEIDPLVTDSNGDLVPQDLNVLANVVVGVNNGGALVLSAKYAFFGVGVYEVDFQVPENTPLSNNAPFAIAVYQGKNLLFGNPSLIPIQ